MSDVWCVETAALNTKIAEPNPASASVRYGVGVRLWAADHPTESRFGSHTQPIGAVPRRLTRSQFP